MVNQKP